MKNALYILFVLFIACDKLQVKKKTSSKLPGLPETVTLGETSEKEINRELGEPINTYDVKNAVVNTYENGKAIKVENKIARSYYRDPVGDEVYLQYWLQLWKEQTTSTEKIASTKDAHGNYDFQLINKKAQITIVYSEETGNVKRVMHFEN